jgi:hypothetical protein
MLYYMIFAVYEETSVLVWLGNWYCVPVSLMRENRPAACLHVLFVSSMELCEIG